MFILGIKNDFPRKRFLKTFLFLTTFLVAIVWLYSPVSIFKTQEVGAFACTYSGAGGTANWSDTSAWSNCNSSYPGSVGNGNSDTVAFGSTAVAITLDVSSVTISTLTLGTTAAANSLLLNGNTLNISSTLTIDSPDGLMGDSTKEVTVGTGTLAVTGLITIKGYVGSNQGIAILSASTGTITAAGGITFTGTAANARLTTTGAATVNLTGTISSGGTVSINSATTLVSTGTSSIAGAYTFGILSVPSGTLSLGAVAVTFAGTSSITGTLNSATGATGTKTFTGAVTVNSGGTFDMSGQNPALAFGAGFVQNSSNAVNLGRGAKTFVGNFSGSGSGGISSGITGSFTISSGTTTNNYTGGTISFSNTLTLTGNWAQGASSSLSLGSTTPFAGAGTFSASASGNTVSYTDGSATIKDPDGGTIHTYHHLTLSGTGTKTMTGITTINGTLTMAGSAATSGFVVTTIGAGIALSSTATLTLGANLAVTGAVTIGTGTTLDVSASNYSLSLTTDWSNSGTFTAQSGTVTLSGVNQTIVGTTSFYNLVKQETTNDATTKTLTFTSGTTTTITNSLTLDGLDASDNLVIAASTTSAATIAFTGSSTFSTTGFLTISYNTVTDSSSGITLPLNPANSTDSGNTTGWFASTYSIGGTVYTDEGTTNIGANKTVAISINGAAAAGTDDTDASGVYSITGLTISAGDVLTLYLDDETENGVTVTVGTGANQTGVNIFQNYLITRCDNSCSLSNANINTANNNGDTDIDAIYTGTTTITTASGVSLYIPASHTFAPANPVSVGGNFANNGTFTHGSSTLTLTGTGTQTLKTNGSSLYNLTINGSGSTYTPQDATTVGNDLTVTAGTLSMVGFAFTVTGATSISGTISTATSATGTKTFTGLVTVNSGGTLNMDDLSPTVVYSGGITQNSANTIYASGGAVSLVGDLAGSGVGGISFNGTLAISSGTTTNNYTGGVVQAIGTVTLTGNWAQGNGSSLTLSSITPFSGSGTFSASTATNTVTYQGGTVTIKDPNGGTVHTYSNLAVSAAGVKTFTGITTANNVTLSNSASTSGFALTSITGNLQVTSSASLTIASSLTVAGNVTIASSGSLTTDLSTGRPLSVGGNWLNSSASFDLQQNTLTLTSTSGSATITSGGSVFYDLTINGSGGTYTLQDALEVRGTLTLTAGTLDVSASNFGISVKNWTDTGAGAFTEQSGTVTFIANGGLGGTINSNETFENVAINHAGTTTLGAALDLDDTLTITAGALDVSASNYGITLKSWTDTGAGTFTEQSGTVTFDIAGGTINSNETFENVTINHAGTTTLGAALDLDDTLTITAGALDVSGSNFGITAKSWTDSGAGTFTEQSGTVTFDVAGGTINSNETFENVTINHAGTTTLGAALDLDDTLTITAGALDVSGSNYGITAKSWTDTGAGTFTEQSGTVTFDVAGGTINSNEAFNSVTINHAGTTTLGANTSIAGALTITSGALSASTYTITLSGTGTVLSNSGTFTAGSSTILITDTSSTSKTFAGGGGTYNILTITGAGTGAVIFSGANTFGNFTIGAPKTITFPASTTTTFTGTFSCTGTAGNVITINSSTTNTQHTLSKASGTVTCDYLSLRDSNATGGATWNPGSNSSDVSNNDGWVFDITSPTIDAGPDKFSKIPFTTEATVTDASGIASYLWVKTSGPGDVSFGSPTSENTTVSVSVAGTYVVTLTATDTFNNSSSDSFTLVRKGSSGNQVNVKYESIFENQPKPTATLSERPEQKENILPLNPFNNQATTNQIDSKYLFTRYLGYGDRGADVLELQKILFNLKLLTATPNGNFGPQTRLAVMRYQKLKGIRQTGNVGPLTLGALNR